MLAKFVQRRDQRAGENQPAGAVADDLPWQNATTNAGAAPQTLYAMRIQHCREQQRDDEDRIEFDHRSHPVSMNPAPTCSSIAKANTRLASAHSLGTNNCVSPVG